MRKTRNGNKMHGGQPSGTYVLNYDGFGRLKDGWHYLYGNPTNAWSERNITYDRNGNVLSLLRYGNSGTTPLNNYTISYEGNRASMLNNEDYFEYDFNGNVTGDAARGMAINYNLLNLPQWFNDGESALMVFYDYLADGTKVALHREDTGMGRAWLGDLVFNMEEQVSEPENPEDGSRGARTSTLSKRDTTGKYLKVAKNVNLRGSEEDEEEGAYYSFESTPYAGGRIESIGNGIKVRKYGTDHLGSVRAIVTDNAVVERSDYYPFGGRHDNTTLPTLTTNRYGFTGKERQNISSSLDPYIDFGARFYDPLTARWFSPDPLADKYTSLTQYNYCGGDPVNFVDPDGERIRPKYVIQGVSSMISGAAETIGGGAITAASGGWGGIAGGFLVIDGLSNFTSGLALLSVGFKDDEKLIKLIDNLPKNVPETLGMIIDKFTPSDQPIFRYAGSVLDVVFSPSLVSITNKSLRPLETIENKAGTIASFISFILQTTNNTDTTNIESNDSNINEIDVDNHIK